MRKTDRPALDIGNRDLAQLLKSGGVAGAGGAGFPTYAKYDRKLPYHMTNAQESEPGYYIDKWLHKEYPEEFADLYEFLLDWGCEKIIVAPKYKDRDDWFLPLERATDARVVDCRGKGNAIDPADYDEPVLFTYTDDMYAFGKEQALVLTTCGVRLAARDLPTDHGFIVNNSETLWNIYRLLTEDRPVLSKFVHVYGETPRHIFLECPLGTPAPRLFEKAGMSIDEIEQKGFVVVDGGPGWFSVIEHPRDYTVTRRTNSLLVIDPEYADPKRNDVRTIGKRQGYPKEPKDQHQQAPSGFLEVDTVRIRLTDNPEMKIIKPSRPIVGAGDVVEAGAVIAAADPEGFSIFQHAPFDGTVTDVNETWVEITR